jgi:hypothetical protein
MIIYSKKQSDENKLISMKTTPQYLWSASWAWGVVGERPGCKALLPNFELDSVVAPLDPHDLGTMAYKKSDM